MTTWPVRCYDSTASGGVIFDLDGTLVDTLKDIAASMNRALEFHGFPPVALEEYPTKVGWGIRRLAQLCLPPRVRESSAEDAVTETVAQDARRFYQEQPLVHSVPYPGIPGLVAGLKRRGLKIAVLTNKPDPVAQFVIGALFPPDSFDQVRGDRPGLPRKPDPRVTVALLQVLAVSPEATLLVGDSEIDMEAAHTAGCTALGVSWGYRPQSVLEQSGAAHILHRPDDLYQYLPLA
ncbi:MAG: HAD family hydrolase [Spirochaetaceae bacterium]|nr:HAD family hydrolase [Spirochaetaceae bacterium]